MEEKLGQLGVVGFVAVAALAGYLASTKPYGVVYVDLGDGRSPAAVRKTYDVSDLDGMALSKKINERLVGDAHVLQKEGAIGLELGQFVSQVGNTKRLSCAIYNKVQLVFMAEGEANSGHAPEMLVEGDCLTAKEKVMWMQPIWIPVADVLSRPTTTNDISYYESDPVSLKFTYVGSEWPKRWVLNSVRLYHTDKAEKDVVVDNAEIRAASPDSILLEF